MPKHRVFVINNYAWSNYRFFKMDLKFFEKLADIRPVIGLVIQFLRIKSCICVNYYEEYV